MPTLTRHNSIYFSYSRMGQAGLPRPPSVRLYLVFLLIVIFSRQSSIARPRVNERDLFSRNGSSEKSDPEDSESGRKNRIFFGYELNEMSMNKFQNFNFEGGFTLKENQTIRITLTDVMLTERHLASDEAKAVDGHGIVGRFRNYSIYYDYFFLKIGMWVLYLDY